MWNDLAVEDRLGKQLALAAKAARAEFDQALVGIGSSFHTFLVLRHVELYPGVTQRQLAQRPRHRGSDAHSSSRPPVRGRPGGAGPRPGRPAHLFDDPDRERSGPSPPGGASAPTTGRGVPGALFSDGIARYCRSACSGSSITTGGPTLTSTDPAPADTRPGRNPGDPHHRSDQGLPRHRLQGGRQSRSGRIPPRDLRSARTEWRGQDDHGRHADHPGHTDCGLRLRRRSRRGRPTRRWPSSCSAWYRSRTRWTAS